jgi:hypothetical protein
MSKFQPIDTEKECRVYFFFLTKAYKPFVTYYNRPQHLKDCDLGIEAVHNADALLKLFGLKKLVRFRIVRTQDAINRLEQRL